MSCGARFPVYALFATAFFPFAAQSFVFSIYLVGIVLGILTGLLLKKTLFKGEPVPFVMELPPYHSPRMRHILYHSWNRLKVFMFRAGRVLVPIVIVLAFFNSLGVDGTFGNEDSEKSTLSKAGKAITPIFRPMGLEEDNWQASVALFTGLFAKEVIVGTLNALYSQADMASEEGSEEEGGLDIWGGIGESLASIPGNLAGIGGTVTSPLGARVSEEVAEEAVAAEELEIEESVFYSMRRGFTEGPLQAYAYLLFVLIYIPCVVAVAAMAREIGGGLTIFSVAYLTVLGWVVATLFYQLTLGFQPLWIAVPIGVVVLLVIGLRMVGKRNPIQV
jgi:ferrous iron transport protein B